MKICLSIDMEQDCPPFLSTYRGVEEGTPLFLKLLREENIPATFFTTGDVAQRYPELMQQIVDQGHELASHGYSHKRFDAMTETEAEDEIVKSLEILKKFYPVVSFRAPNLEFPEKFLPLLEKNGIRLDSSTAHYKFTHRDRIQNSIHSGIKQFPASVTSSVLRLPFLLRHYFFWKMKKPAVLFVHPWEFVDFRKSNLRLDCRFRTGTQALDFLRKNILYFKAKKHRFLRMKELIQEPSEVLFG